MSSCVLPKNLSAADDQPFGLEVNRFHGSSTDRLPRPATRVLLSPTPEALRVRFDVTSSTLLAAKMNRQSGVCTDSCVEFFFEPVDGAGYLNIEINCIGTPLAQFHPTYRRDEVVEVDDAAIDSLRIETSLPHEAIVPERRGAFSWWVSFEVPFETVAAAVARPVDEVAGPGLSLRWRGNFYKCGDKTSSPHWASWAPIHEKLDFHVPECFAPIVFDDKGRFVGA